MSAMEGRQIHRNEDHIKCDTGNPAPQHHEDSLAISRPWTAEVSDKGGEPDPNGPQIDSNGKNNNIVFKKL